MIIRPSTGDVSHHHVPQYGVYPKYSLNTYDVCIRRDLNSSTTPDDLGQIDKLITAATQIEELDYYLKISA